MASGGVAAISYLAQALKGYSEGVQRKHETKLRSAMATADIAGQQLEQADKKFQTDQSQASHVAYGKALEAWDKSMNELKKIAGTNPTIWGSIRSQFDSIVMPHTHRKGQQPVALGSAPSGSAPPQPSAQGSPDQPQTESYPNQAYAEALGKSYASAAGLREAQAENQTAQLGFETQQLGVQTRQANAQIDLNKAWEDVINGRVTPVAARERILTDAQNADPNDRMAMQKADLKLLQWMKDSSHFQLNDQQVAELDRHIGSLKSQIENFQRLEAPNPPSLHYPTGTAASMATGAGLGGIPYEYYSQADRDKIAEYQRGVDAMKKQFNDARIDAQRALAQWRKGGGVRGRGPRPRNYWRDLYNSARQTVSMQYGGMAGRNATNEQLANKLDDILNSVIGVPPNGERSSVYVLQKAQEFDRDVNAGGGTPAGGPPEPSAPPPPSGGGAVDQITGSERLGP